MKPIKSTEPELQGEGNYTAARRHRKSVEAFVAGGRVKAAGRAAAPKNAQEAAELLEAERKGRAPKRG